MNFKMFGKVYKIVVLFIVIFYMLIVVGTEDV